MRVDSYGILAGLLSTIVFAALLYSFQSLQLENDLASFVTFYVVLFVLFGLIGFGCSRASRRYQRKDRIRLAVFTFGTGAISFPLFLVLGNPLPPLNPALIAILGVFGLLFGGFASAGSAVGGYMNLRYSTSHSGRTRRRNTKPLDSICARCGFRNPRGFDFCGRCGMALTDATRVY